MGDIGIEETCQWHYLEGILLTMGNYVLKSLYIHRAISVLLSVCGKLKHPMMTYGTVP